MSNFDSRRLVHPYNPTNVSVSAENPQKLLKSAEQEKHIKYDEEASYAGATFVPFALESTGGFGTEALLFIKELIAESKKQHMVWHDKEYVNMVYRNIAIAVARGNTTRHGMSSRQVQPGQDGAGAAGTTTACLSVDAMFISFGNVNFQLHFVIVRVVLGSNLCIECVDYDLVSCSSALLCKWAVP